MIRQESGDQPSGPPEAEGLTSALAEFTAVNNVGFSIGRLADFGFLSFPWLRKNHHHEDADRVIAAHRR